MRAWAVFFLTGQRLKRLISGKVLRDWALNATGYPEWLVVDSHASVGDSAETVSLLLDHGRVKPEGAAISLSEWMEERILPLRGQPAEHQEATVVAWWDDMPRSETFLLEQALDRRVSGRRLQASGGSRPRRSCGSAEACD